MPTDTIVSSPAITVAYVGGDASLPIPEQATYAVDRLESLLPSLRGQKFFGTVVDGQYRACVRLGSDVDEKVVRELPKFELPAGRYVHRRLVDWNHDIELLVSTVNELVIRPDFDPTRYVIEHYRSHTEVVIRVPVH